MKLLVSTKLRYLLYNWPIAIYLIPVPVFFCAGAGLEFAMIKWRPNGHNFYDTYKKNRAIEIANERLNTTSPESKS